MKFVLALVFTSIAMAGQVIENPFEKVQPEEGAQVRALNEEIKSKIKVHRDAHAKAHGCVADAKVTVGFKTSIPRVGLFAEEGKTYDAIVRFSAGSGNPGSSDLEGGPQGFALKILLNEDDQKTLVPVFGESELFVPEKYYRTFDILTISPGHEFMVETIGDYPAFFKATAMAGAAAKMAAEAVIKFGGTPAEAGAAARAASGKAMLENYIKPATGKPRLREGALLAMLGKARPKNLLQLTYGSWVPSLYGKSPAKYEIGPCETVDPDKYEIPAELGDWSKNPGFLSEVLKYELAQKEHCFELRVQRRAGDSPSVEDAVAAWPTDVSYEKVAEIRIPKKAKGSEIIDSELCEAMSFHPGHAPAKHYPIGGIQRARIGGIDKSGEPYEGVYTVIHRERNLNRRKP